MADCKDLGQKTKPFLGEGWTGYLRRLVDPEGRCKSPAHRHVEAIRDSGIGCHVWYPIELKLEGRTVVVVGLGPVGRRKAAALVAAGARVIGMDPAAGQLDRRTLSGIEVVVAAVPGRAACTGQAW